MVVLSTAEAGRKIATVGWTIARIIAVLRVNEIIDFCNFPMRSIQSDVRVGVQGQGYILVPQHLLDNLRRHTRFHHSRGEGVPQGMHTELLQFRPLDDLIQVSVYCVGFDDRALG